MPSPITQKPPTPVETSSNHETPAASTESEESSLMNLEDRFEKMPKTKAQQEHAGIKDKTEDVIIQASSLIKQLNKTATALLESIQSSTNSGIAEINSHDGHVNIALKFQGKDLVDMLEKIEGSINEQTDPSKKPERMTNYAFLLRSYQTLFDDESKSVTDWLKVKTENSPYGEQLHNLHDHHRNWLSLGQSRYYGPLTTHKTTILMLIAKKNASLTQVDQLKNKNDSALREQLSAVKQVKISDDKIAKLAKNSIKNQTEINRETNVYKNNATAEEKLGKAIEERTASIHALELQLPDIETQIKVETEAMEPLKKSIDLHEKKLALLEILLGLGGAQDTANPVRVQLMQIGIISFVENSKKEIAQIQANSDAAFQMQTELQDALIDYNKSNSNWSKFWLRRDITELVKKATLALENIGAKR